MTQLPDPGRFWARVDMSGGFFACWPWSGAVDRWGYGRVMANYREIGTHRVALLLSGREIAAGFQACHRCDNPPCCNPLHLYPGTPSQNQRDASERGRRGRRCGRIGPDQVASLRGVSGPVERRALAERLGITDRHARRLLTAEAQS